jgi:uncharacterized protein YjbI with pentapeptide repeats
MASELEKQDKLVVPEQSGLEVAPDTSIESLIQMLSRSTQALTTEEYVDSIRQRQEAVDKFLLRGGVETLRKFFDRIRQLEEKDTISLDLSMIEISGKILSGLYLPGANLDKLIFTESDISGSNLTGASLNEAVAPRAIMRGVIATGANFSNAVLPGVDMSGGRFVGGIFINTVMPDVIIDSSTNFAGALFIGTYIGRTDLSVANTAGAVFRGLRR